jgi:DNA-binding IclR family transcriptional regulator
MAKPSDKFETLHQAGDDDPLFVTALARGLAVLQACGESETPPTLSQIVKQTGLPQPTVWRLCHTMFKLGFLERTEEGRIRPALAVLTLGHGALSRRPLAELARPGMAAIARRYPGAVSLGVRQELEMVYIHRVEGGEVIFSGLRTGSRVSLLSSAMGWGLLAGMPEKERTALLRIARQRESEEFMRVQKPLQAVLDTYEKKGWILNKGVLHPEINAIAVPVGVIGQSPVASLSFGGSRSRFPPQVLEEEVGPELRALAMSISPR